MEQTLIPFLKAIHVVGFVSWFAGMFYLGRLLVYHVEANDKPQPDQDILKKQYQIMLWRVYKIIMNPAMMITWTAGLIMIALNPTYLDTSVGTPGWMHLKLTLLVLLTVYHVFNKRWIKKLEAGEIPYSDFKFRLLNEVPTIFLVLISFIAVYGLRGTLNYGYLFGGIILFIGLIYWGARAYKKRRAKAEA